MRLVAGVALAVLVTGCWGDLMHRRRVGALTLCRADDVTIVSDMREFIVARDCHGEVHRYRVRRDGTLRPWR
jgi:hypothetical protein